MNNRKAKRGWKPSREKKMSAINCKPDAMIEFQDPATLQAAGSWPPLNLKSPGQPNINPAISQPLGIASSMPTGGKSPIDIAAETAAKKIAEHGTTTPISAPSVTPGAGYIAAGEAPIDKFLGGIKSKLTPSATQEVAQVAKKASPVALRDLIAIEAMKIMATRYELDWGNVAEEAYALADSMMKARKAQARSFPIYLNRRCVVDPRKQFRH